MSKYDIFNELAGAEDGRFDGPIPDEDRVDVEDVHPRSLAGKIYGLFKATVWRNRLGYGAYGDTPAEAIRRATALYEGDREGYRRRGDA